MNLEEAKTLPLRKEPTMTENIRVVMIENFDYNGCGGTHPKRTGEVGPIQVLSWERNKGGIRLTFIAGWRALKLIGQQQQIMKDVSKQLNSSETDIPAKVAQLLTSQKENEKAIQTMNEKLLFAEANELLQHPIKIHAAYLFLKYLQIVLCKKSQSFPLLLQNNKSMQLRISSSKMMTNYNVFSLAENQHRSI